MPFYIAYRGDAGGASADYNELRSQESMISIIVPCHRVVGSNGSLTGYGGGIKNKIELLKLEGNDMRKYFVPKKGTAL